MPELSPSAYVVLGLLAQQGSMTPYALDRVIRHSIGHFWVFPRSQLYAEAARLVRRGLAVEEREDEGRRRRSLTITPTGRAEFATWLAAASPDPTEIRDDGLLRLFFHTDETALRALAAEQVQVHRRKLAEFEAIAELMRDEVTPRFAALALGLRYERMVISFWQELTEGGHARVFDPEKGGRDAPG